MSEPWEPSSNPSMSSVVDSPARTSPSRIPGPTPALDSMGPGVDSGENMPESFASYDPATSSWKTAQHSLFADSIQCSPILPASGSMRSGRLFELPTWGPGIGRERMFICAYTNRDGLQGRDGGPLAHIAVSTLGDDADWPVLSAPLGCRGADGIPDRVDRTHALGNAVVPQITEWIARRILAAEMTREQAKEQ